MNTAPVIPRLRRMLAPDDAVASMTAGFGADDKPARPPADEGRDD